MGKGVSGQRRVRRQAPLWEDGQGQHMSISTYVALCCAGNYVAQARGFACVWRGSGLSARHISGGLEALEEREQRVRWAVAAGLGVRGGGAGERPSLELQIGRAHV